MFQKVKNAKFPSLLVLDKELAILCLKPDVQAQIITNNKT